MKLSLVLDLSKAAVAMYVSLFCLLVGYNNIVDYNTNYQFVEHVLAMDQMKPFFNGDSLYGRAVTSPTLHTFFYAVIIAMELLAGLLCFIGALIMFVRRGHTEFSKGQAFYVGGVTIALGLWYFGFAVIGAEWFSMWANTWNGQMKAYTFAIFILLTLIYVLMPRPDRGDAATK